MQVLTRLLRNETSLPALWAGMVPTMKALHVFLAMSLIGCLGGSTDLAVPRLRLWQLSQGATIPNFDAAHASI